MIIVDSSVWIAYYRPDGKGHVRNLIKKAISSDVVVVNGIIIVEVLNGISKKVEYQKVRSDFKGFHYITLSVKDFFYASLLGSSLRKKGITIPSTDLIIAASALKNKSILYHLDSHFDLIAEHTSLKVKNLTTH